MLDQMADSGWIQWLISEAYHVADPVAEFGWIRWQIQVGDLVANSVTDPVADSCWI